MMNGNGNPVLGLVGLWMFLQVVFALALLLGGIYLLYSIGRAAAGLERMADSAEEWIELQKRAQAAMLSGGYVPPRLGPAPAEAQPAPAPQAFVPGGSPGANLPSGGGLS